MQRLRCPALRGALAQPQLLRRYSWLRAGLMAVIDARSRTIPGVCTACIAASGIAWRISLNEADIAGSLAVAFAAWALLAIGNRLSCALRGERGIGGGDVRTLPVVVGVLGASGAVLGLSASAGALAAYLP